MAAITVPGMFLTGNHASRPAASAVGKGSLYSCTDHSLVYQSDGSSWTTWASLSGTGIAATIVDAKGDLIAASAADTVARLAVGSDGQVLVPDASQSTGLKWAFAPAFVGVQAYHNTTQAISANTNTACSLNSEDFDTHAFHDTSTNNSRITIPSGKGGYYLLQGTVFGAASPNTALVGWFRKNGSSTIRGSVAQLRATGSAGVNISAIANLAAADYIELFTFISSAINIGDATNIEYQTTLRATLLGT